MSKSLSNLIFLDPLSKDNNLSKQLKEHTGSSFSAKDFYSEHLGPDANCTPAGVLVHKESGTRLFAPFKGYKGQKNDLETLTELVRIERFEGGVGGYQWGDYRIADGNFGGSKLDKLEEMGLARRTGKSRPSGMGGSWPEVEVTDLGREVIQAYVEWSKEKAPSKDLSSDL
jgi:hypothetical protein